MNIQHCLHNNKDSEARITFWEASGGATSISYAGLYDNALRLLGGLQHMGIKKGSHLLLSLDGLQSYITALWACWLGGLIPVAAAQASWHMPSHPGGSVLTDSNISGERVIHNSSLDMHRGEQHSMRDEDTALLLYTSGSTAAPRCVVLSGANLYEGGLASSVLVRPGIRERYLGWLPLTHIFGLVSSHIVPLFNGFDHCLMHAKRTLSTPGAWLSACAQYAATITSGTPSSLAHAASHVCKMNSAGILEDLGLPANKADSPADNSCPHAKTDLSSVYVCLCGGESLREATLRSFEQAVQPNGWGSGVLCPAYGMSETTMGICYNPPGAPLRVQHIEANSIFIGNKLVFRQQGGIERLSLGILDDCNEVQIRDLSGNPLPDEHLGVIHVKGSNVCQGYLPPATPTNPDADGWLDTGDLGYFKDGWLTVLARHKDMLCYNGVNYIRTELENEARTIGGQDELALVEACGILVLAGKKEAVAALQQAKLALSARGLPVSLALVDELPLTAKGTVDRLALEMLLEQNSGKIYLGEGSQHGWCRIDPLFPQGEGHARTRQDNEVSDLNEAQAQMARLWGKRLNVPMAGLSPDSHFIQLGGDSLTLVDLACDIEDSLGVYVDSIDLAAQPTLQGMCDIVEGNRLR